MRAITTKGTAMHASAVQDVMHPGIVVARIAELAALGGCGARPSQLPATTPSAGDSSP
jgi:hypothetical protein